MKDRGRANIYRIYALYHIKNKFTRRYNETMGDREMQRRLVTYWQHLPYTRLIRVCSGGWTVYHHRKGNGWTTTVYKPRGFKISEQPWMSDRKSRGFDYPREWNIIPKFKGEYQNVGS